MSKASVEIDDKLEHILATDSICNVSIPDIDLEQIDRGGIVYVCADCREIVEVEKVGKYRYKCKKCQGKHIALATAKSASAYYKI